jgi:hypothetical protein
LNTDGSDEWTFRAIVAGKGMGIVTIDQPPGTSEREAAPAAKDLLEGNRSELEGIASSDPFGVTGEQTSPDGGTSGQGGCAGDGGDNDGGDDSDDGGDDGDEVSGSDDEGDGVGGGPAREERIAAAIAHGLISGAISFPDDSDDGDGTGQRHEEHLTILIARVTSSEVLVHHYDLGNGLGDDVAGINHERLAALVARALARGGITPQPDDSGDGDGTGHPVRSLGRVARSML